MSAKQDISGQKYGMLTAIKADGKDGTSYKWLCKCDCGNYKSVSISSLNYKKVKSCGCLVTRERVERQAKLIPHRWWQKFILGTKKRHKIINIEITPKDVEKLYFKQNGICVLSGEKIYFPKNSNETRKSIGNVSIDRIDSLKHYTIDNIQLVTKKVNMMKQNLSTKEFIDICNQISTFSNH